VTAASSTARATRALPLEPDEGVTLALDCVAASIAKSRRFVLEGLSDSWQGEQTSDGSVIRFTVRVRPVAAAGTSATTPGG
jgi:hypothetical protein